MVLEGFPEVGKPGGWMKKSKKAEAQRGPFSLSLYRGQREFFPCARRVARLGMKRVDERLVREYKRLLSFSVQVYLHKC